ncbi:MAG: serine protease [Proteobacteria bacterium]|nr:serine protease [Pseudomonadota bacterium]
MATLSGWRVPSAVQPRPEDYLFDLDAALATAVCVHSRVPSDAYTARTLGDERIGNGVLVPGGLVLTIGYLIVEAETIWLSFSDGSTAQGHTLGYDQESGFALIQPLSRLDFPTLEFGDSSKARKDDRIIICAPGGVENSIVAHIVGRQEFAGYWEYLLDQAIFSAPAHPHWGGAPLIDSRGRLIGIGSLQLQASNEAGSELPLNMSVPVNLLKPIFGDLKKFGRANRPVRPWLGLYSADMDGDVVVLELAQGGPAERAGMSAGDIVLAVAGEAVHDLADFYRKVWRLGAAGVEVPLTVVREQGAVELLVNSADRDALFKSPSVH